MGDPHKIVGFSLSIISINRFADLSILIPAIPRCSSKWAKTSPTIFAPSLIAFLLKGSKSQITRSEATQ